MIGDDRSEVARDVFSPTWTCGASHAGVMYFAVRKIVEGLSSEESVKVFLELWLWYGGQDSCVMFMKCVYFLSVVVFLLDLHLVMLLLCGVKDIDVLYVTWGIFVSCV